MKQILLRITPQPSTEDRRTIIKGPAKEPYFRGGGDTNYLCGNCGFVLAAGMYHDQVKAVVFCCPGCGHYNDTDTETVS
jgi:hypothetical protein